MPNLARIFPVSLLALALAPGCGDDGGSVPISIDAQPPDAAPRETVTQDVFLAPGEITEGIMTGGAGDLAEIHLTAPMAELDWNIHGHAGGGTQVIHEEYDQMKMDYIFAPTSHADWYLLFRNSGPTDMLVKLKVDLHGGMQWRWQ